MKPTAYDFKEFYATDWGPVIRAAVASAIQKLWPDMRGRRVLVFGYGAPYVDSFAGAERLIFLMPPEQGAYPWPEGAPNQVALSARTALPIESNSLDGVVLIHSMEFTNAIEPHLAEIWRVLKSQGRVMVIVPNRIGLWSRADWAPFGQGTPFTLGQVQRYLRDALFIPERREGILWAWPWRTRLGLRLAPWLEKYMGYVLPTLAGLHVIEASKQVYAGLALPIREGARVKAEILVPSGSGR